MLENIQPAAPDAILGLTEAFRNDDNPGKINLGVGVYQDGNGNTPLLKSVARAEERILEIEESKSYLPIPGAPEYGRAVRQMLFGVAADQVDSGTAVSCHTPGGTGALRVGADFLGKFYPNSKLWLSEPTWANHKGVFPAAGFELESYPYYDPAIHGLDFAAMKARLETVAADEIVLLHACCHNPTGVDLDPEQWEELAAIAKRQGWVPFLDFAYQGFGTGLDADAHGVRTMLAEGVEFLVASSFSKNFSLYCERAGALTLVLNDAERGAAAFSHLKKTVRTNYSNPPAHGGLIVATILTDPELKSLWESEVAAMRERLRSMRKLFAEKMRAYCPGRDFGFIEKQWGMFSFSGLTPDQVAWLREERSIYIVGSGRINTAGIREGNVDYLCESIKLALESAPE